MNYEKEPTRSELLAAMHNAIITLQDALAVMSAEALAAEEVDPAYQRTEVGRREVLERLRDASQRVVQAMADYHEAHANWVQQFEQETREAAEGQQALQDLLDQ